MSRDQKSKKATRRSAREKSTRDFRERDAGPLNSRGESARARREREREGGSSTLSLPKERASRVLAKRYTSIETRIIACCTSVWTSNAFQRLGSSLRRRRAIFYSQLGRFRSDLGDRAFQRTRARSVALYSRSCSPDTVSTILKNSTDFQRTRVSSSRDHLGRARADRDFGQCSQLARTPRIQHTHRGFSLDASPPFSKTQRTSNEPDRDENPLAVAPAATRTRRRAPAAPFFVFSWKEERKVKKVKKGRKKRKKEGGKMNPLLKCACVPLRDVRVQKLIKSTRHRTHVVAAYDVRFFYAPAHAES